MTADLANRFCFRPAKKADIDTLVKLWQQIDDLGEPRPFGGDSLDKPAHAKTIIKHTLESPKASILVCTANETIIGTISGHVFDKPAVKLSPVGVIYSLWVDPQHRNQGIAQHLLNLLEASLTTIGSKALQVGWDQMNTTAAKWWQARGFTPYEVIASKNLK